MNINTLTSAYVSILIHFTESCLADDTVGFFGANHPSSHRSALKERGELAIDCNSEPHH